MEKARLPRGQSLDKDCSIDGAVCRLTSLAIVDDRRSRPAGDGLLDGSLDRRRIVGDAVPNGAEGGVPYVLTATWTSDRAHS